MKSSRYILCLSILLFVFSACGYQIQAEVTKRYADGRKNYTMKVSGYEEGNWTSYYENGQIKKEGNFKDGKEDGKWTYYYENGQIKEEVNFKNGEQDGKWTYYYEDGTLQKEEIYKDEELIETIEY